MELLETIHRRRSHRGVFITTPIAGVHLQVLIEAARWAPSPFNVQPWELVIVTDGQLKKQLADITSQSILHQFQDREFLRGNTRWMRLTRDEWQESGDGVLLEEHVTLPPFVRNPERLRGLLDRTGLIALLGQLGVGRLPAREFAQWVEQSPMIIVVFMDWHRQCPGEAGKDWMLLGLGAMIQNLLLAATSLGIGAQFVNAPLESTRDREQVRMLLGAPEILEPFAMLRLGYTDEDSSPGVRRDDFVHHNTWREEKDGTE